MTANSQNQAPQAAGSPKPGQAQPGNQPNPKQGQPNQGQPRQQGNSAQQVPSSRPTLVSKEGYQDDASPNEYQNKSNTNPNAKENPMNQDQIKGKFDQVKGKIKETWGKMSDDDIALYNGKRDQFLGKVQEQYGLAKEEAEDQLKEMERNCASTPGNRSDKAA